MISVVTGPPCLPEPAPVTFTFPHGTQITVDEDGNELCRTRRVIIEHGATLRFLVRLLRAGGPILTQTSVDFLSGRESRDNGIRAPEMRKKPGFVSNVRFIISSHDVTVITMVTPICEGWAAWHTCEPCQPCPFRDS